jgi:hypothetical protein
MTKQPKRFDVSCESRTDFESINRSRYYAKPEGRSPMLDRPRAIAVVISALIAIAPAAVAADWQTMQPMVLANMPPPEPEQPPPGPPEQQDPNAPVVNDAPPVPATPPATENPLKVAPPEIVQEPAPVPEAPTPPAEPAASSGFMSTGTIIAIGTAIAAALGFGVWYARKG